MRRVIESYQIDLVQYSDIFQAFTNGEFIGVAIVAIVAIRV